MSNSPSVNRLDFLKSAAATRAAADAAITLFHTWMRRHQLGRKRVLDTLLAATYRAANVTSLLTLNTTDFMVFDEFACVPLFGTPA